MQFGPDTPSPVCAMTAASSRPSAASERVDHGGRWHQHDHMVGILRQRMEIGIAGLVPDLTPARIDQIDRAGKFVAVEIVPDARRPAPRPVAGADQDDVARRGERRDLLLGRIEIQFDPPFGFLRGGSSQGDVTLRRQQSEGMARPAR